MVLVGRVMTPLLIRTRRPVPPVATVAGAVLAASSATVVPVARVVTARRVRQLSAVVPAATVAAVATVGRRRMMQSPVMVVLAERVVPAVPGLTV